MKTKSVSVGIFAALCGQHSLSSVPAIHLFSVYFSGLFIFFFKELNIAKQDHPLLCHVNGLGLRLLRWWGGINLSFPAWERGWGGMPRFKCLSHEKFIFFSFKPNLKTLFIPRNFAFSSPFPFSRLLVVGALAKCVLGMEPSAYSVFS